MTKRFEKKYIINKIQIPQILRTLSPFLKHEPTNTDFYKEYHIHSIYFDTPYLKNYYEKMDGIGVREKLRVRWYGDDIPSYVFLENKGRVFEKTHKKHLKIYLGADDTHVTQILLKAKGLSPWMKYNLKNNILVPIVQVNYVRKAYLLVNDPTLRITFDSDMTFSKATGKLDKGNDKKVLPTELTILEIKARNSIPKYMFDVITKHALKQVSFSKYAQGVQNLKSYYTCIM